MEEFYRIKRLPPNVFNITGELKAAAGPGENLPMSTSPQHIVLVPNPHHHIHGKDS